jgi:hypothetical protein
MHHVPTLQNDHCPLGATCDGNGMDAGPTLVAFFATLLAGWLLWAILTAPYPERPPQVPRFAPQGHPTRVVFPTPPPIPTPMFEMIAATPMGYFSLPCDPWGGLYKAGCRPVYQGYSGPAK